MIILSKVLYTANYFNARTLSFVKSETYVGVSSRQVANHVAYKLGVKQPYPSQYVKTVEYFICIQPKN